MSDQPECGPTDCCLEQDVPALPANPDEAIARLAKALAHPARVRILRLLLSRASCTCGEVVAELPLAQATVSQHLKVLKEAGLVEGRVDGSRSCYCANPHYVSHLRELLETLVANAPVSA
ncbi:MAG: metalloregulator ArsR/SmtB family transcription factor [Acidimicrobiia bacterium]